MNTFDFHRSFFTFRIDTLVKQPLTVTHKPVSYTHLPLPPLYSV